MPLASKNAAETGNVCGPPPTQDANKSHETVLDVYELDPAMWAENRARLVKRMQARPDLPAKSVLLFEGGHGEIRHETDHEKVFRQESNFSYLFGVKEPDCMAIIEVDTGKTTLLVPKLPEEYAVWMGPIRTNASLQDEYKTESVEFVSDIKDVLEKLSPSEVHTTRGLNKDSDRYAKEATFEGIDAFKTVNSCLYDEVVECRVIKTEKEQMLMKHINRISSEAHLWVMQRTTPGMREFQQESMFNHWGYFRGGCRHTSYTNICGSGSNGSILHYGHAGVPNWKKVNDGDMCLLDMGAEFNCYTSDITCSFPANGKFTEDQRAIYETVYDCQMTVMAAMKPGVSYIDMHELSNRTICEHLKVIGILVGEVDAMMEANMGAVFQSHGLGHFMGLDTHDVGGRVGTPVLTKDGFKSLRCCRVLLPGMVLTVEPGVYFNDYALGKALEDPEQKNFINEEVLKRFRGFGGVRLEDDVIVTETGIENMTRAPRTVQDVEAVMAGKITELNQLECRFTPKYVVK